MLVVASSSGLEEEEEEEMVVVVLVVAVVVFHRATPSRGRALAKPAERRSKDRFLNPPNFSSGSAPHSASVFF